MDRAVPALLAALVVLASAGAVVGVSPPGTTDQRAAGTVDGISANTTDVLVLESIDAATFDRADLVVTRAVDAQSGGLVESFEQHRVTEAVAQAESEDEQRVAIRNATDEVDRRTQALVEDERAAREAFVAGEMSAESYLVTLGQIHARASSIEATVQAIDDLDSVSVGDERRAQIRAELSTLQGPVRAELAAALQGDGPSKRTFVGVSTNGVTLATLDGNEYVRETVRTDNRDDDIGRLTFDEAEGRFAELYPWASENKQRISMGALGSDVYVVEYTHGHGTIHSSLDASTGEPFREEQTKSLADTPATDSQWIETGDLVVGVSDTYPGGPVRVNVTNATGAPVAADVSVNGTAVGESSDRDGVVWAISPAEEYTVTVTSEDASVEVQVDPASNDLEPVDGTLTQR
ncbi:MAG: DUF7096 domain-containing protein [Halobacteriota archaeon]